MTVSIKSEPLTYDRHDTRISFFRDVVLSELDDSRSKLARERLTRHSAEMIVIEEERNQRALSALRSGDLEYRVEPNRTDGTGGYFTVPQWMNQFFATAVRPGRVLAGLIPRFDLPNGVSSINIPILSTGTKVKHLIDNAPVTDQDIVDTSGSSTVVTIAGQADVSMQALEQSPGGASLDWALLLDMAEDYDRDLETELLSGRGSTYSELTGVANVSGINSVTFTSSGPTGSLMWPYFGEAAAQIGDNRLLPPECYLMRTSRWSWLTTAEDTAGRPFGLSAPFFLGSDAATPNPAGGLISWPVFLDDAISPTQGAGADQDSIICLRPRDMILLEGQPQTNVFREVLSGTMGARIQFHNRVAAITSRYPTGISSIGGTGCTVQSSF
jgi:HK97 family phage major capsid protein